MSQNFSFRQAAVIGAGTMGRGIVMCLANAGLDVQWLDSNPQMLNQGSAPWPTPTAQRAPGAHRRRGSGCAVRRHHAGPAPRRDARGDLVTRWSTRTWNSANRSSELDAALKPSVVLASNTSYLTSTPSPRSPRVRVRCSACTSSARRTSCGC